MSEKLKALPPTAPLMNIYSIKDIKMGQFNNPACQQNHAVMMRGLSTVLENPESPYAKFPMDYQVFQIGTYNPVDGQIDNTVVEFVCNMAELVPHAPLGAPQ